VALTVHTLAKKKLDLKFSLPVSGSSSLISEISDVFRLGQMRCLPQTYSLFKKVTVLPFLKISIKFCALRYAHITEVRWSTSLRTSNNI